MSIKKFVIAILLLSPFAGAAQTDVLILQKNGRNIKTYDIGQTIIFKTIYDQWLGGTITMMRNDSIFLNNIPFHVHEIAAIRNEGTKWNYVNDGTLLIIAGVGVLVLNVINGIYFNEKAGTWVATSGWITAGAFIIGGLLMRRARYSDYNMGKKYTLHYLNMKVVPIPAENQAPVQTSEPAK
jgi:hypothetical protein